MQLVDSHAHIDLPQFDGDREAVLRRAAEVGVEWIVDVGADLASSRRAVELAACEPAVWAAVGIHPHDAATLNPVTLAELRALARRPGVVAIGEIGLDFYRDLSPRAQQREAFAAQLTLARELDLPVIVHDREAHAETLSILRTAQRHAGRRLRGVMHCFSGDPKLARAVLDLGFYVGVAGPVTYPRTATLAEVVRLVPFERLLIETDCPYLAVQARRGARNEPAFVHYVAARVAELRGVSPEEVGRVTSANAHALFDPRPAGRTAAGDGGAVSTVAL